jgi:hypothetical protein
MSSAWPWEIGSPHAFALIETQVVRVHAHAEITIPGSNHIDVSRWQPLLYVFQHYVGSGWRSRSHLYGGGVSASPSCISGLFSL